VPRSNRVQRKEKCCIAACAGGPGPFWVIFSRAAGWSRTVNYPQATWGRQNYMTMGACRCSQTNGREPRDGCGVSWASSSSVIMPRQARRQDVRVIEEAIDHDEAIATAVAAARKVDSRMTISLARRVAGHRTHALEAQAITGRQVGPVACISIGVR
jgi:hypothetical protein